MFYSSHISQFMPMSINANVPKILENAPAQVYKWKIMAVVKKAPSLSSQLFIIVYISLSIK